jgi:FkbM family methyltransferase
LAVETLNCLRAVRTAGRRLHKLYLRDYRHPLYFRSNSSDAEVIRQVFGGRDYRCVEDLSDVSLIIDCGANIGCTTYFLLHRYPQARAVVVEPDGENFSLCRRNLAPFRDRVTFVRAGVWSAAGGLKIERGGFRDGKEWSFQVRPCAADEAPDVVAVTIDALLQATGRPVIDILKIDVERSERELFGRRADAWLTRTRNLVIELHDEECERVFAAALSSYRRTQRRHGELTVCRNLTLARTLGELDSTSGLRELTA